MNESSGFPAEPWRGLDVTILIGGQVIGLALLLTGWIQASGTLRPGGQIGSLNLAIVGAAVAVAAGLRFVGRGRRAVTTRRGVVARTLRISGRPRVAGGEVDVRTRPTSQPATGLVSSDRMTRYHRAGCQLIAAKPVTDGPREQHEAAGRRPCGVCQP